MAKINRPGRPATTDEAREKQLVSMAYDLAEKQLSEGTISSQALTQFLKMGTERERLERRKIENENSLLEAKAEDIASGRRVEELYSDAIKAMRTYTGQEEAEGYED